jgi:hypothetical protein
MTKKASPVSFTGDVRSYTSDPENSYIVIIPEHGSRLGEGHILPDDETQKVVAQYEKIHGLYEWQRNLELRAFDAALIARLPSSLFNIPNTEKMRFEALWRNASPGPPMEPIATDVDVFVWDVRSTMTRLYHVDHQEMKSHGLSINISWTHAIEASNPSPPQEDSTSLSGIMTCWMKSMEESMTWSPGRLLKKRR